MTNIVQLFRDEPIPDTPNGPLYQAWKRMRDAELGIATKPAAVAPIGTWPQHVESVVNSTPTLAEAAAVLGINPSTLYRMRRSGKIFRQPEQPAPVDRRRKAATCLAALFVAACAWSQPMPSATNEPAEPITYPRMVMWNAVTNADSYTLSVNGTNIERTSETHSANVPLVEGTNRLSIVAHRGELASSAATTNYIIMQAQIVEPYTVKAPSPSGPWTRAQLPGPLTNSTGTEYYKIAVRLERKILEHHN